MISIPDVRGADVVFDLDGTLLHGDLGETVFYNLLLHDKELGDPRSDPVRQSDPQIMLNCRGRTAQILALYQALHQRGREARAYKLTARIIGRYSVKHVRKMAKRILELDVDPVDRKCRIELPNNDKIEYVLHYGARIRRRMMELFFQRDVGFLQRSFFGMTSMNTRIPTGLPIFSQSNKSL